MVGLKKKKKLGRIRTRDTSHQRVQEQLKEFESATSNKDKLDVFSLRKSNYQKHKIAKTNKYSLQYLINE